MNNNNKWKNLKMESPRERLKKRKQMEQQRQKELEEQKKKAFRTKIIAVIAVFFIILVGALSSIWMKNQAVEEKKKEKTSVIKVIKNTGQVEVNKSENGYYTEDDVDELSEGDSIRLSEQGKARLDFGNEVLFTLKNGLELTIESIDVRSIKRADLNIALESGTIIGRVPTGRGNIVINHKLGEITIEPSSIVVFKVESKDFGSALRVVVKQGKVSVKGNDDVSRKVLNDNKYLVIDKSKGFVSASDPKDINVLSEAWD